MNRSVWSWLAAGGLVAGSAHAAMVADDGKKDAKTITVTAVANNDGKESRTITVVAAPSDNDGEAKQSKRVVVRQVAPGKAEAKGKAPVRKRAAWVTAAKTVEDTKETYLGIVTATIPELVAVQLPGLLSPGQGLVVERVLPDSPAAKSGLQKHDILATFEDQKLVTSEQLKKLTVAEKPGAKVTLGVIRQGKLNKLAVTLGERKTHSFAFEHTFEFEPRVFSMTQKSPFILNFGDAKGMVPTTRVEVETKGEKGQREKSISISISVKDGEHQSIDVHYTDDKGNKVKKSFEGKPEEVRKKLGELPEDVRKHVDKVLGQMKVESSDPKGGAKAEGASADHGTGFLMTLVPSLGDGKVARYLVRHADGAAQLELDESIAIENVLKDVEGLPPEVLLNVESVLHRVRPLKAEVRVENSQ